MLGGRRGALPDGDSTRMTTSSSTRVRRRLDRESSPWILRANAAAVQDVLCQRMSRLTRRDSKTQMSSSARHRSQVPRAPVTRLQRLGEVMGRRPAPSERIDHAGRASVTWWRTRMMRRSRRISSRTTTTMTWVERRGYTSQAPLVGESM